jgi:hypothetical protein
MSFWRKWLTWSQHVPVFVKFMMSVLDPTCDGAGGRA